MSHDDSDLADAMVSLFKIGAVAIVAAGIILWLLYRAIF